ncbi:MAG: hypothetical protein ACXVB1_03630 [Pseudobdellovibrionaceae bacterium]
MAQNFRWDLEWYNTFQTTQRNQEGLIDPTGRRLANPQSQFETDLRINTRYSWQEGARFVFRPRLLGDLQQYHFTEPEETTTSTFSKLSLPETYLEKDLSQTTTVAVGLQNYQWGPAEFIGPSNPFFHFRTDQRAYNYKENGRFLIRMNWIASSHWSLVALAEPMNNGDSFWIFEQKFKPKGAVRVEHRGDNSLNYFGIDAGTLDDTVPFIGEYFNFEILQGLSVYWDARQSKGSAMYNPDISSSGVYDMVYVKNTQDWDTLLVTGVRWEGDVDLRLEYIYNSYGLTKDLMLAAFQSAVPQHPRGDENMKRILSSGRELLGQHYAYLSLRFPDLFVKNNNLSLRYLRSLMDQSATAQAAFDTALGDAWTLYAEADYSLGDSTQELSALEKASGQLGLKWNF